MLASWVRFASDAAGLEKSLRLLQSICTIAIGMNGRAAIAAAEPEILEPWVQARSHFLLGRRYFRLLKWHPCWSAAYVAMQREQAALRRMIEVLKWTFLGAYFFLEMFTITNALGATHFAWGPRMQLEANKCWFYAISISMVLSLYDLFGLWFAPVPLETQTKSVKTEKVKEIRSPGQVTKPPPSSSPTPQSLFTQLVIDACDLTIPGSAIGWTPVDGIVVGICSAISTVLAGQQIWQRVQANA